MESSFIDYFEQFGHVSQGAKEYIKGNVTRIEMGKKALLLKSGAVCNHIYFLHKGTARMFIDHEDRELTIDIAIDGELVSSFSSFVSRQPCRENIELLEDSILFGLHYDQLQFLYEHFPEVNKIGRLIAERHYISLSEHTYMIKFGSSGARYAYLFKNKPELIQKAPLGMIASYLGMTSETLSRIRSRQL